VIAATQYYRSGSDLWSAFVSMPHLGESYLMIGLVVGFLAISLSLHEAAHGWVAWLRGDPTAKELGRVTLNPLVHIDPVMTVILPVVLMMTTGFIFGGAKPVPVQMHRLRHPLRDMSLVALAGPASNFLLALLFALVWKVAIASGGYGERDILPMVMLYCVFFNVLLAVFNLVPIPPLDGSRVMTWLLPAPLRETYVGLERWGMLVIFFLIFLVPPFRMFLSSGIHAMFNAVDLVTGGSWS
jgi:Zn-dependent protease